MKRVLVIASDVWACGYYRIKQPYTTIKRITKDIDFEVLNIENINSIQTKLLLGYDAIVLQRPTHPLFPKMIRDFRKYGKKIIVEIDDLLTNISPTSSCFAAYKPGSKAISVF